MIAFDSATSASDNSGVATSLTYAHTNAGSNLILMVGITITTGTDLLTGVTYAGAAMTLVGKIQRNGAGNYEYLFYKINPATGNNNVVASFSSAPPNIASGACSYTGALQTGQPDSSATGTVAGADLTLTTTVVASNCWLVACFGNSNSVFSSTGTQRVGAILNTFFDSNGVVGTGAQSLQVVFNTGGPTGGVIASIASAPEAGGGFFAFF